MAEIRGETDLSVNDNEKKEAGWECITNHISIEAARTSINSSRLLKIEC